MKIENIVPGIVLVCGLVQIILGISFFLDYETLIPPIGLGAAGAITTNLSFVIFGVLNKNKGQLFDERFRTRCVPYLVLAYGITNIGITLTISSVFYDVGSVKGIDVLLLDVDTLSNTNIDSIFNRIAGFLLLGMGLPLLLLALTEFAESRKA